MAPRDSRVIYAKTEFESSKRKLKARSRSWNKSRRLSRRARPVNLYAAEVPFARSSKLSEIRFGELHY